MFSRAQRRHRGHRHRPRRLPARGRGPRRAHLGRARGGRRQRLPLHPAGRPVSAAEVVARCRELAAVSEEPGRLTPPLRHAGDGARQRARRRLDGGRGPRGARRRGGQPRRAPRRHATQGGDQRGGGPAHAPLRDAGMARANALVGGWMGAAGHRPCAPTRPATWSGASHGADPAAGTLLLGSHLDTVRDAGRYDGPLGVLAALPCVERAARERRRCRSRSRSLGFADEEGLRYGTAYLGSRAVAGSFDARAARPPRRRRRRAGATRCATSAATRRRRRAPRGAASACSATSRSTSSRAGARGPRRCRSAWSRAIAGPTRAELDFTGRAGHAGTVPMDARRDARVRGGRVGLRSRRAARARAGPGRHRRPSCRRAPGAPQRHPRRGGRLARRAPRRRRGARGGGGGAARRGAADRRRRAASRSAWREVMSAPAVALRRRADRARWPPRSPARAAGACALASGAGHDAVALARADRRRDALRALRRRHQPPPRRVGRRRPTSRSRSTCSHALRPRAWRGERRRPARSAATTRDRRGRPTGAIVARRARARRPRRARRSTRAGCSCCPAWSTRTSTSTSPGAPTGRASPPAPRRWRRAATTCAIDMPLNAHPPTIDARRLRRQGRGGDGRRARRLRAVGRPRARRPRPPRRARRARRRRLQGVHVGQRGRGVRGRRRPDAATRAWPRAARLGLPVAVHAESEALTRRLARRARGRGPGGRARLPGLAARASPSSRRSAGAIAFAAETGCALHVVHVSSGRGVALVAAGARARGRRDAARRARTTSCSTRTTPSASARWPSARRRCAPPASARRLWAALRAGDVDLVASDHSPAPAGAQGRATTSSRCGAGSPAPRRCWRCSTTRASWRRGLAPASAGRPARRGPGAALRPGAGQGRARGRRRRRPGARRPGGARGRSPARSCSTATGSARSWAARCAAAWCARSCAGARSRATGGPSAQPCGRVVRARRLGLCAVSALHDAIAELARVQRRPRRRRDHPRGLHADLRDRARVGRRAHARRGPRDAPRRRWQPLRPLGRAPTRTRRCVLTGSHVDTTLNAGRYDGVLGVLGAIEAVRALRAARRARRGARSRSSPGRARSRASAPAASAAARPPASSSAPTSTGSSTATATSMADALRGAGFDPDRLDDARIDPATVHALVELHIEQGIVLETHGEQIGVVTAIAAPARLPPDLPRRRHPRGRHADGACAATRWPARPRRWWRSSALARESPSGTTVGTVGVLRARPGAINVVPGEVELDVDVRDSDLAAREQVVDGDRRGRARDRRAPRPRGRGRRRSSRTCRSTCDAGGGRRPPQAACRELGLSAPPDDQRRLPRRDDHGPPRAGRHDLRPQRRRRQPPPRRVHRARGPRPRRRRCWRERSRGWRPRASALGVSRSRGVAGAARRLLPHRGEGEWRWPAGWRSASVRRRCSRGAADVRYPALRASFATRFRGRPEPAWPGSCVASWHPSFRCANERISSHPLASPKGHCCDNDARLRTPNDTRV